MQAAMRATTMQFLQCVPLRAFDWSSLASALGVPPPHDYHQLAGRLSPDIQRALLDASVAHPLAVRFPPPLAYKCAFLKHIVSLVDVRTEDHSNGEDWECIDELLEAYLALMALKKSANPIGYRSFVLYAHPSNKDGLNNESYITLRENSQAISQGTTGLRTWPAALALLAFLQSHHGYGGGESLAVHGKCVLELGCGVGLVGIACARLGAARVVLTDVAETVLATVERNCNINGIPVEREEDLTEKDVVELVEGAKDPHLDQDVSPMAVVASLDWGSISQATLQATVFRLRADLIVASDVVYDPSIIPHFVRVLDAFLRFHHAVNATEAYVASTKRSETTYGLFLDALTRTGLRWESIRSRFDENQGMYFLDETGEVDLLRIWAS
ncbi:hypothetical protein BC830DRAFT_1174858 [Chytriomyces sp. MP71]|nr:hypothetical protein BC830DRAFT_1174858 [Chytriomyces sp. MP71]